MHSAASVAYPVARSPRVGWLFGLVWLLGAVPVAWWALTVPAPSGARLAVAGWSLLAGAWAASAWWRSPTGLLRWDGSRWRFDPDAAPQASPSGGEPDPRLSLCLDLQSLMLLRLQDGGGSGSGAAWLFVERGSAPQRWHRLRCAVVASISSRLDPPAEAARP